MSEARGARCGEETGWVRMGCGASRPEEVVAVPAPAPTRPGQGHGVEDEAVREGAQVRALLEPEGPARPRGEARCDVGEAVVAGGRGEVDKELQEGRGSEEEVEEAQGQEQEQKQSLEQRGADAAGLREEVASQAEDDRRAPSGPGSAGSGKVREGAEARARATSAWRRCRPEAWDASNEGVVLNCGRAKPTNELLAHCCAIAGGERALELEHGKDSKRGNVMWVYGGKALREALLDPRARSQAYWITQIPGITRAVQKHRLAMAFRLPIDGMLSAELLSQGNKDGEDGELLAMKAIAMRESGNSFMPRSWVLPDEYDAACEEIISARKRRGVAHTWIFKPSDMSCGRGIGLVRSVADLEKLCNQGLRARGSSTSESYSGAFDFRKDAQRTAVLQEYVEKPMTHMGRKFDLRLYVTLVHRDGEDGWRVLVCREGLARVCAVEYTQPKRKNIGDVYRHLTNFTVNKSHAEFDQCDVNGNCLLASVVLAQLEAEGRLPEGGAEEVWRKIDRGMVETAARIRAFLSEDLCAQGFVDDTGRNMGGNFFHLLGVDVLLTDEGEPFLLEVNPQPIITVDAIYKVVDCGLGRIRKVRLTEQINRVSANVQHWFTLRGGGKVVSGSPSTTDSPVGWDTMRRDFAKLNRTRGKGRVGKLAGIPHWAVRDILRLKKSLAEVEKEEGEVIPGDIPVTLPGKNKYRPTKDFLACLRRFHPPQGTPLPAELNVPSCAVPVPTPTGMLNICRCKSLGFPHVHMPAPNDYRANVPAVLQALAEVCPEHTIGDKVSRALVDGLVRRFAIRVPAPVGRPTEDTVDFFGGASSSDELDVFEPDGDSCDDLASAEDVSEIRARLPSRHRMLARPATVFNQNSRRGNGLMRSASPIVMPGRHTETYSVRSKEEEARATNPHTPNEAHQDKERKAAVENAREEMCKSVVARSQEEKHTSTSAMSQTISQTVTHSVTAAETVYMTRRPTAVYKDSRARSRTRETLAWVPDSTSSLAPRVRPSTPKVPLAGQRDVAGISGADIAVFTEANSDFDGGALRGPRGRPKFTVRSAWGIVHVNPEVFETTLHQVNERAMTLRLMRRAARDAARYANLVF